MAPDGQSIAMLVGSTNNAARPGSDDAVVGSVCRCPSAMADRSTTGLPIRAHWLLLDLLGAAMLVAGVLGLAGAGAHLDARLGDTAVA